MVYVLAAATERSGAPTIAGVLQRMGVQSALADDAMKFRLLAPALHRGDWVLGFLFLQNALHAGPIAASRATMLMVTPVVSVVLGAFVFREARRAGVGFVVLEVLSLGVMLLGAHVLSQSPRVAGSTLEGDQGEMVHRRVLAPA
jgi:hypothetical protein